MERITFDARTWHTKEDCLRSFQESLNFADHFGMNLDALNDALRDFEGAEIVILEGALVRERPWWKEILMVLSLHPQIHIDYA